MPQIIQYTDEARKDFKRISDFMLEASPETHQKMILELLAKIDMLKAFPEIGKFSHIKNMREFTIPFGKNSYIALYLYEHTDVIQVTGLKHSKELKFTIEK